MAKYYYRADEMRSCLDFQLLLEREGVASYAFADFELGERVGIEMNFKAQGVEERVKFT